MTSILDRAKSVLRQSGEAAKSDEPSELQKNAEKALRMKQEAGAGTTTPEHRTSHDGGVKSGQVAPGDPAVTEDATSTSNLKRSHNARSGDS
jgi:hypothetical protein